ncbi:SMC-Scp complex subunit ScpB [Candidatus Bathyarchaeota archaeon]|nr:SMC-Scp complex subunit ScpB [Candidatus Bathyarchaeota archaeon]
MKDKPQQGTSIEQKRNLAIVEAALYVSGRPLDLKTVGSVLGTRSYRKVKSLISDLAEKYSKLDGALEIIELQDERYVMQLRNDYLQEVKRLSMRPLVSRATLQTLAYVAFRQPVAQAHVALVRGGAIYGQIRELRKLGLVSTEKLGKTQILKTTDVFSDYFNLSRNPRLMRRQLANIFEETGKNEEVKDASRTDEDHA